MSTRARRRSAAIAEQEELSAPAERLDLTGLHRAIERMAISQKPFKAPTFDGTGDVELYITQFADVVQANAWSERHAVLHLRAHLDSTAKECGRGTTVAEINTALRARFGTTSRQAKDKLMQLSKSTKTGMHEHATEVQRLVGLAFPTLPALDQEALSLDYFNRSMDNKALQRHMLALRPANVAEAVQAAEEFATVGGNERAGRSQAMHVGDEGVTTALAALTEAVQTQSALLTQLVMNAASTGVAGSPVTSKPSKPARKLACYQCGGPHLKRQCPQLVSHSGNGQGPAQH